MEGAPPVDRFPEAANRSSALKCAVVPPRHGVEARNAEAFVDGDHVVVAHQIDHVAAFQAVEHGRHETAADSMATRLAFGAP